MNKNKKRSPFSGRRIFMYAFWLAALFCIIHAAGCRQYTNILSGTASYGPLKVYLGMLYILLYLCFIILVPIFLLAFTVLKVLSFSQKSKN